MKLLYTNENPTIVANEKNIVEANGIDVVLKNEFTAGRVTPGYIGLPELWVVNDAHYDQAVNLIETSSSIEGAVEWVCAKCNESNDPSFELCWNCQRANS